MDCNLKVFTALAAGAAGAAALKQCFYLLQFFSLHFFSLLRARLFRYIFDQKLNAIVTLVNVCLWVSELWHFLIWKCVSFPFPGKFSTSNFMQVIILFHVDRRVYSSKTKWWKKLIFHFTCHRKHYTGRYTGLSAYINICIFFGSSFFINFL